MSQSIQTSRASSRRSRHAHPLEARGLDLTPSRTARNAVLAWWLFIGVCVAGSVAKQPVTSCLAGVLAVWLSAAPLRQSLCLLGPHALRRVSWDANGMLWVYTHASGRPEPALLAFSAARFGARWLWFVVTTPSGRRAALIDRQVVDRAGFVRLIWLLRFRHSAFSWADINSQRGFRTGRVAPKLLD